MLARGRPTENRRSPTAAAGYGGFVPGPDYFFGLLDRYAMRGDVLNIPLWVLGEVPDALHVRHRLVLQLSCIILQEKAVRLDRKVAVQSGEPAAGGAPAAAEVGRRFRQVLFVVQQLAFHGGRSPRHNNLAPITLPPRSRPAMLDA
jgi:hypothetical protein